MKRKKRKGRVFGIEPFDEGRQDGVVFIHIGVGQAELVCISVLEDMLDKPLARTKSGAIKRQRIRLYGELVGT